MSGNVLTVKAKLDGDASGLAAAGKRGAAAVRGVKAAVDDANKAGSRFELIAGRIAYSVGTMVRGAAQVGGAFVQMGARAVGSLVRIATRATMAGAAMATVFAAGAMKAGLDRLMSIQDATVALTRMLGGAAEAAKLTSEVLEVVKGTPFAFPQFAEATRQLVAFGVKAEKIPGVLRAIADSAAASGEGAEAVGRITEAFSRMAVTGKLNYDIIESLGSAGVNALGLLANHFGITTQEAQQMVSDGMIPADQAMDILVKGIEEGSTGIAGNFKALKGAAQELGQTISGSLGNVKAAFARMGAAWLKPFEKDFPRVLNDGVIPLLDKLGEKGQEMTQKIADTGVLDKAVKLFQKLTDNIDPLVAKIKTAVEILSPFAVVWQSLKAVMPTVVPPLKEAGRVVGTTLVPALAAAFEALVPLIPLIAELAPVIARGITGAVPLATAVIELLIAVLEPLIDILNALPTPILGFGTALVALQGMGVPVIGLIKEITTTLLGLGPGGQVAAATGTVTELGTSMEKTGGKASGMTGKLGGVIGFFTGPWGMAIGGAIAALGLLWAAFEPPDGTSASIEGIAASLGKVGQQTEQTRGAIAQVLNKDDFNAIKEVAEAAGVSFSEMLNLIVDASLGVDGARSKLENYFTTAGDTDGILAGADAIARLRDIVVGNNGAVAEAADRAAAMNAATDSVKTSQDAVAAAIQASTDSIKANGDTLDQNTSQGQANKAQLDLLNAAAEDLGFVIQNSGLSVEEMTQKQREAVPALMDTYRKFGMNEEAARNLTAEVLGIPKSKVTEYSSNASQAIAAANAVAQAIRDVPGYKEVIINQVWQETGAKLGEVRAAYNANGGLHENGVKAYANGGTAVAQAGRRISRAPQMMKGGANILWGEKETGWEAYISGKKSELQRNQRVWEDAGERMGMFSGAGSSAGGVAALIGSLTVVQQPGQSTKELVDEIYAQLAWRLGV